MEQIPTPPTQPTSGWTVHAINDESGMIATAYQHPRGGLIVKTFHTDTEQTVKWYRADTDAQVLEWLTQH